MYSVELKIKRLSLADETRRIKAEMRSNARQENILAAGSLQSHLATVVRPAARAAHLAHGYLRNMAYARIEQPRKWPDATPAKRKSLEAEIADARSQLAVAVAENVHRFGTQPMREAKRAEVARMVEVWMNGGAAGSAWDSNPESGTGSTPSAPTTPLTPGIAAE